MSSYLETIYFKNETGESDYPQLLCNHLVENYFGKHGSVEGKKMLDIGSGKGNHLLGFLRAGLQVYGLDKRKECVEVLDKITIKPCDLETEKMPYEDNSFDFVYSKSVLEHVTNTDNFLSEAYRVLKPGGLAVMLTPDWRSQSKFFWDDYTHVRAFTRKSLQNAMKMHQFKDVSCDYFLQLPLVWKYPILRHAKVAFDLIPDSFKWRDKEESDFRPLVRFFKEEMLLAVGTKK